MKITGFEVFPASGPPALPRRAQLAVRAPRHRRAAPHGYGEMMLHSARVSACRCFAAMMADVIEQAVIEHDPYDTEMLFDKVYGRAGYSHYPELTKLGILSAIEMACWDIIGKDCGQPVYKGCSAGRCVTACAPTPISTTIPRRARTTPVVVTAGR